MKHNNVILFAFPGLGKTTFTLRKGGFVDLDYGYIRKAMSKATGVPEPELDFYALEVLVQSIANDYLAKRFHVFVNEPSLIPALKQSNYPMIVVVPKNVAAVTARLLNDPSINTAWKRMYRLHAADWKQSWIRKAERYGIPVVEVDGLSDDWETITHALPILDERSGNNEE